MTELKREMSAAQEKASQQLSRRIGVSTYQFQWKGNEYQFNFNCEIEDHIDTVKSELTRAKMTDPLAKDAIRKAELSLDEGAKSLAIRQKHIKIADCSDLSWATVRHYMADPLADGPDDEKEIARLEKQAQKDLERAQAEKGSYRRGGGGGGKQRWMRQVDFRYDPYGDHGKRERYTPPVMVPPPVPQRNFRPRVLGPCFRCSAYGHIQSLQQDSIL